MPWPQNCSLTLNPWRLANSLRCQLSSECYSSLDCLADHVEALSGAACSDREVERLLGRRDELPPRLVSVWENKGRGRVAVEPIKVEGEVDVDDVLGLQCSASISDCLGNERLTRRECHLEVSSCRSEASGMPTHAR